MEALRISLLGFGTGAGCARSATRNSSRRPAAAATGGDAAAGRQRPPAAAAVARGDSAESELLRDRSAPHAWRAARVVADADSSSGSIAASWCRRSKAGACICRGGCSTPIPSRARSTCTGQQPAARRQRLTPQPVRRTTDFVDTTAAREREHTWWVDAGRERQRAGRVGPRDDSRAAPQPSRIAR